MWKYIGIAEDYDRFLVDGINVFAFQWQPVPGEFVEIKDPYYHQPFTFPVYTVTDGNRTVKFASGEFSNSVWGFYVPE